MPSGSIDIKVDLALLTDLQGRLSLATNTLALDDFFAETIGEFVGHPELEEKIRSFAGSWNDNRRTLSEKLVTIQTSVGNIAAALQQIDRESANAITQHPGGG
jgi:hypothetical protein